MSDRDEMVAFCRREHRRLVGVLTLHLGDRWVAEELAQEALIRACERWAEVGQMQHPRAWVTRVGMNLANSWIRRRVAERKARARLDAHPELVAESADTSDALAVREALAVLPERQRQAVVLRYWGGMSPTEAGAVMGIEPGTVRALTHQAVTALRGSFEFDRVPEEAADVA